MADCIDKQIDANFVATLKTIVTPTYNTAIGTVERTRRVLAINNRFPYTLVIQMEPDEVEQWANLESDNLNYVVWHFDGNSDDSETIDTEMSYRLGNVHADIQKALRVDPTRGGLAQNTEIKTHGFGIFVDGEIELEGAYVVIEIHRTIDPDDPYQLA